MNYRERGIRWQEYT